MKLNRAAISSLFILVAIVVATQLRRCDPPTTFHYDEGVIFGTIYHITYEHPYELKGEIEAELQRFDNSLSPFNKRSIITHVNRNDSVTCDTLFTTVFNRAKEIFATTGGAFDPTISPLINAWGFGFSQRDSITPQLVDSLMQWVGMDKVSLDHGVVTKARPEMTLNFSAIAKGYACDVIANYLKAQGVENLLVEIGGEVVTAGDSPRGGAWRVGVNKPIEGAAATSTEVEEVLLLHNCGMATSGNYRNFYRVGNQRIAHTLDPHTGYPVQHSLLSATVIAPDCMSADAYATAFMVLGVEQSLRIVEATPHLEVLFISAKDSTQYTLTQSSGMGSYLSR